MSRPAIDMSHGVGGEKTYGRRLVFTPLQNLHHNIIFFVSTELAFQGTLASSV